MFRLQPKSFSKAGWAAGASWPHTGDHCRIYNVDYRIHGESAMINET